MEQEKYNQLTVLNTYIKPNNKGKTSAWCKVLCDCSNILEVKKTSLKNNNTKSCGCLKILKAIEQNKTHDLSKTPLYAIWTAIKQRCFNTKHSFYKNYGERGITVYLEWLNDFIAFYDWALAAGYKQGLQIDRINNDGNYEPNNCRFVTPKENNSNKRNNIIVWLDGLVLTASEASRQLGHSNGYIKYLIAKNKNPYFPRLILNLPTYNN